MGPGSILAYAQRNSLIFGSGFIDAEQNIEVVPRKIFGVRGRLSADQIKQKINFLPRVLSDPGLLVSKKLYKAKTRMRTKELYIPHVSDSWSESLEIAKLLNAEILYPTGPTINFLKKISEAQMIYSRSLHGLIFADSYQIPRVWISPSKRMKGGLFKFLDYHSSLDIEIDFIDPFISQNRNRQANYFQISKPQLMDLQNTQDSILDDIFQYSKRFAKKPLSKIIELKEQLPLSKHFYSNVGWKHLPSEK